MKDFNYPVRKRNDVIMRITKERATMPITSQKAIDFIISCIDPKEAIPDRSLIIRFDIKLFCNECGIALDGGKNYRNIKNALNNLTTNFWIGNMNFQWIVTPDLTDGTVLELEIPRKVLPFIMDLKENFTMYDRQNVLCMNSKHSITLYQILKCNAFKGHLTLSIDEIKGYMGLSEKYTYKNLKARVIIPAIKEINEKTDIRASWKPIRKGRKMGYIEFSIMDIFKYMAQEREKEAIEKGWDKKLNPDLLAKAQETK